MWERPLLQTAGMPPPKYPPPAVDQRVERENRHLEDGHLIRIGDGYTRIPARDGERGAPVERGNMRREFYASANQCKDGHDLRGFAKMDTSSRDHG